MGFRCIIELMDVWNLVAERKIREAHGREGI